MSTKPRLRRIRPQGSSRLLIGLAVGGAILAVLGLVSLSFAAPAIADTNTVVSSGSQETTEASTAPDAAGLADGTEGQPRYVDEQNCLSCHGDPSLVKKLVDGTSISVYVNTEDLPMAVHRYLDCTTCHTSDPHEVQSPLTKLSQAEKCGGCHEYQYNQHKVSVHGVPIAGGNSDPATCADCHSDDSSPHDIVRVLDPSASTYRKNIAETCAKCHDDEELMDKYGIVEKVYDSYMGSFHGKAMKLAPESATLQQLDEATCTNCHGVHNIVSTTDPDSPVAGMEHLLDTCRLCHSDAGPEFVKGFLGHRVADAEYFPGVYWGGTTFFVLSRVILGFGAFVVVTSVSLRFMPWIGGKLKRRKKNKE